MSELFMGFWGWFPLVPPWEFTWHPPPSAELYRDEYNVLWCSGPLLDSSIGSYGANCTTDAAIHSSPSVHIPSLHFASFSPPPCQLLSSKRDKVKWQLLWHNKSSLVLLNFKLFLNLKPSEPKGQLCLSVQTHKLQLKTALRTGSLMDS